MPETEFDPEQFQRIIAYYRDCIEHDSELSVVLHQGDEGQKFVPLKLGSEWKSSGEVMLRVERARENAKFVSELGQSRASVRVMYGYPFLVNRVNRRIGLIPVFLQPVEHDLQGDTLRVDLGDDWPVLNDEYCRLTGVSTREEKTALLERLGLATSSQMPPDGLSHFVRQLRELEPLPTGEPLDPCVITQGSIFEAAKSANLLNRHALVITNRPTFTRSLDMELEKLTNKWHANRIGSTASSFFFGVTPRNRLDENDRDPTHPDIIEVVPLNEEQRSAVRSAFHNDLTVVTGPPGTGKSQIVTTVIANAWLRGQSVLFASYNHKAVDVVESRVNSLASRSLMVRTGRRAGHRDLRNEIARFLSNLLASNVSDQERLELTETRRLVECLERSREEIWRDLESVRGLRNRVYQIDNEIAEIKTGLRRLHEKLRLAHDLRKSDEIRLNDDIQTIQLDIKQLTSECEVARCDRDDTISAIDMQIQDLWSAIERLRQHADRVNIGHPRIALEFVADLDRRYDELDSFRKRIKLVAMRHEAEIDSLKQKLARLRSDFDLHLLNRSNSQDLSAIKNLMLNAQAILESQTDGNATIWDNLWKRLRRRANFKRIKSLVESWAEGYDILGNPPSGPIVTEQLEMWSRYVANAIARLDEWEKDFERNQQTEAAIEKIENEIARVESDFESNRFQIREVTIEQTISELVEKEVQSLFAHIDELNAQSDAVRDEFDQLRFDERIAALKSKIDGLRSQHEIKHNEISAEVNQLREEVQKNFSERSRDFDEGIAKLSGLPKVNDLATQLDVVEKQIWDAGARLIDASMRVIPDHFDIETRKEIHAFRALFEQLQNDQLGRQRYAVLRREMEELFPRVMSALPAWCVTNLSASNIPLHAGMFDLVVIDEASQCSIPSALPLLYRAKRALIIGDPHQLRHITKIGSRKDHELQDQHKMQASDVVFSFSQESLFDVASSKANPVTLREHFRSHADIIGFSNQHWYEGTLEVCTKYEDLRVPTGQTAGISWHQTNGQVERSPRFNGNVNNAEANELANRVVDLIANRGFRGSVGIVTPFRAQANLIRSTLHRKLQPTDVQRCDLITDTSHGFQGDERDIVFFSPCVEFEMPEGAEWFIRETDHLFNVAITSARAMLVIVGNHEACLASKIDHVKRFAEFCNVVNVREGHHATTPGFQDGPDVGAWERPFYEAALKAGLKPMHQYIEGQNRLDFAFDPEKVKLNVEVDGELYHREWDGRRSRIDLARDRRLIRQGWKVKRFWVYEIRDELERCVAETKELLL